MKISIIGTAGIPSKYGGFETLVENLAKNKLNDIIYTVFCSMKMYQNKKKCYYNAKLKYINLSANGISSVFYDLICMFLSLNSDIMLILGVSGSLFLPVIKLIYSGKIITNIDGIEWKRKKWNIIIKNILKISEKAAIKFSNNIVCDNQGIIEYVKMKYKKEAILIEYGSDHVIKSNIVTSNNIYKNPYAVTVCRIEPENNIHLILKTFSKQKIMNLLIIGNWENSNYGKFLKKKYINYSCINILDPIYDLEKINYLRSNACLYIHGHSAGGTNPSLVEAMNLGLPVLAYDCIYNRYTTENKCLYWSGEEELLKYIKEYKKFNLENISIDMENIAKRRYTWKIITSKYEDIYFEIK